MTHQHLFVLARSTTTTTATTTTTPLPLGISKRPPSSLYLVYQHPTLFILIVINCLTNNSYKTRPLNCYTMPTKVLLVFSITVWAWLPGRRLAFPPSPLKLPRAWHSVGSEPLWRPLLGNSLGPERPFCWVVTCSTIGSEHNWKPMTISDSSRHPLPPNQSGLLFC